MRAQGGLQCPRCNGSVKETQEFCPKCNFRFRLSNDSLRHTARHGDSIHQTAASRDLEQTQSASSLQGASFLIGFFAAASFLSGLNALTLQQGELACSNVRNFICAIAQAFGGKDHLNTAYAIIFLVLGFSFGAIAWKLHRKSLSKMAAALASEAKQE